MRFIIRSHGKPLGYDYDNKLHPHYHTWFEASSWTKARAYVRREGLPADEFGSGKITFRSAGHGTRAQFIALDGELVAELDEC